MKKTLIILTLAVALVFAMATVAQAKYAGALENGVGTTGGYLSWGDAQKVMTANGVSAALKETPHGGYTTTTTKCSVCHSAHRATGSATVGVIQDNHLTDGGANACLQCHTAWGSAKVDMLVEWSNNSNQHANGPHTHRGGCSACHTGGIHGVGTSQYGGMNAFMLGGETDALIAAELPLQAGRVTAGGNKVVDIAGTSGNSALDWFVNGTTAPTMMGNMPSEFGTGDTGLYAAQLSLVTGYTCAKPGCHNNSVFGNTVWGQTYSRDTTTTSSAHNATGHSTAPGAMNAGGDGSSAHGCAPCHSGTVAGGYRYAGYSQAGIYYYSVTSLDGSENNSARAYGCDQCHDAVGKLTNSTAWPHSEFDITFWEWDGNPGDTAADVVQSSFTTVDYDQNYAGGYRPSLWMYASNMAAIEESTSTGHWGGTVTSIPANSPTGYVTKLADPSYKLMTDVIGPPTQRLGLLWDSACLKCHVAFDAKTVKATGDAAFAAGNLAAADDAKYLRVSGGHHGTWAGHPANPDSNTFNGFDWSKLNPYDGSADTTNSTTGNRLLYLWR
ncbi:MAG: hypothetical protein LBS17_01695 [Actinomycetes bacterium]|nr:hypothetical protein [Actinomycetes bacterium]